MQLNSPDLQAIQQWQLIMDNCPTAIAIVDCQMRYLWVNAKWLEDLRKTGGEVLGKSHYQFFAISKDQQESFQRCLAGDLLSYTDEIYFTNGHLRWQARPWQQNGEIGGLIISHQVIMGDTIAQKYAQCMLQKAQLEQQLSQQAAELALEIKERLQAESAYAQLGTALESASDAIGIFDVQGQPLFVNQAFLQLFGFTTEELKRRGMASLFVNETIAEQITTALNQGGSWAGEVEMHTKRQVTIPVAVRTNAIRDPDGDITGSVGIFTDISDRKAAESEVLQGFSLLNAALEATADGILVEDLQGNIVICNHKFADLWQLPVAMLQSLQTQGIKERILAQVADPESFLKLSEQLPPTADSFDAIKLKDGRTIERYSQPQRINGECVGRVWGYRDITARILAEEALRASEQRYRQQAEQLEQALKQLKSTQAQLIQTEKLSSLGQLIAGISHEINNPINFIYGNLFHAEKYLDDILEVVSLYCHYHPDPELPVKRKLQEVNIDFLIEDLRTMMSSIRVGAERIHGLVQSLHKFARADSNQLRYADIHHGIDGTLVILHNRLKANNFRPEIQVFKNYCTLGNVECYPGQLNQVFMNILANAIDALDEVYLPPEETTAPGLGWERSWQKPDNWQPCIWITTQVVESTKVQISIKDNAGGMPEHVLQKIFDPFFTTKPAGKGTGLGLSISYKLITENHHGSLVCHTIEGEGTEFVITIPILQEEESDLSEGLTRSLFGAA
ncbi:MAG: PAS domain S-box protein [Pseudanabaenaceae cyanobacterium]